MKEIITMAFGPSLSDLKFDKLFDFICAHELSRATHRKNTQLPGSLENLVRVKGQNNFKLVRRPSPSEIWNRPETAPH